MSTLQGGFLLRATSTGLRNYATLRYKVCRSRETSQTSQEGTNELWLLLAHLAGTMSQARSFAPTVALRYKQLKQRFNLERMNAPLAMPQ
jgi:hypothetical protein